MSVGWKRLASDGSQRTSWLDAAYVPQEIAYAAMPATVQVTSTSEAAPTDVVSAGAVVFDGQPVWVEFFTPYVQVATGVICWLTLWQDGAQLGRLAIINNVAAAGGGNQYVPVVGRVRLTPSAGSHTIKVCAFAGGAGCSVGSVGGYEPGYISIQRASSQIVVPVDPAFEGAAPPPAPYHGQRWITEPTPGVKWEFRHNAYSASAYKWEFVGGTSLYAEVVAHESTSNAAWSNLTTPGPLLTVPRAGEYDVAFGARAANSTANQPCQIGFGIAGSDPVGDNLLDVNTGSAAGAQFPVAYKRRGTVLAAGNEVRLKYRTLSGVGPAVAAKRWLDVLPARVS